MRDVLENHLMQFDGIAVSVLAEARNTFRHQPAFLETLARLSCHPNARVADGATWILKAEVDDGTRLPRLVTHCIVAGLDRLSTWQAKLHILQAIEGFHLVQDQADVMYGWAERHAEHTRPLLRAWSVHARVILGQQFENHRAASLVALDEADRDKAASVRARARQLRKRVT